MTATQEIISALNQSYGSASSKAFIASLCEGEGGIVWNILYGAGTLRDPTNPNIQISGRNRVWTGDLNYFPDWGGAELRNGSMTHAAGGLQFEPASYNKAISISNRSTFYPQDQIQNGWVYANLIFSERFSTMTLHNVLELGSTYLQLIPTYLGSIWIGGADSLFPKRFNANLPLVTSTHPSISSALGLLAADLP